MAKATTSAGIQTVTPHLAVAGAADAIKFYRKAFGATEVMRMPADDGKRLLHAELRIGKSTVFLTDVFPEWGGQGPAGGNVQHLRVDNADATFKRAIKAGASVAMPLEDMFWGDRYGKLVDPFGQTWSVGAAIKKAAKPKAKAKTKAGPKAKAARKAR
jgi:PhnB protein